MKLDHPNLVKLYDIYKTDQHYILVQEICNGGELFYYLAEKKRLTEKRTAEIMK